MYYIPKRIVVIVISHIVASIYISGRYPLWLYKKNYETCSSIFQQIFLSPQNEENTISAVFIDKSFNVIISFCNKCWMFLFVHELEIILSMKRHTQKEKLKVMVHEAEKWAKIICIKTTNFKLYYISRLGCMPCMLVYNKKCVCYFSSTEIF